MKIQKSFSLTYNLNMSYKDEVSFREKRTNKKGNIGWTLCLCCFCDNSHSSKRVFLRLTLNHVTAQSNHTSTWTVSMYPGLLRAETRGEIDGGGD